MPEELGVIQVSDDVIRSLVDICSQDIDGIANVSEQSLINGAFKMLRASEFPKGIRITTDKDNQHKKVDISVHVDYGIAIPPIVYSFQKTVKSKIEEITGLVVDEVNIYVDGVESPREGESGDPRVLCPPGDSGVYQGFESSDDEEPVDSNESN